MKTKQIIMVATLAVCLVLASVTGYGQNVKMAMGGKPSSENSVSKMTLFPNPASSLVEIKIGEKTKKEGFDLEVFDSSGVNVLHEKWNGEKLDVSAFQPGVYIVTLRKNKLVYSQKLIVARE